MSTLQPKDVPGAMLRNISIEDHSVFELRRWLECRGYKKTGSKEQLITRIKNCIKAGNENKIFPGIDGGKWYDLKHNSIHLPTSSSSSDSQAKPSSSSDSQAKTSSSSDGQGKTLVWGSFPSCDIPRWYNKGHIYTYIVGAKFDDEDPETTEINLQNTTTVKPFKKGSQFVSSDHISDVQDGIQGKVYFCKSNCLSSFQKAIKYNVSVTINTISGAVIAGSCECKQSAMGKCSHVTALLLFIWEYTEKYGHCRLAPTSLPRQWGLGSRKRNPKSVLSAEYPIKRYRPIRRALFNPLPEDYVRNININNFIGDLQKTGDKSMFQSVLHLEYEDFEYSNEEVAILKLQIEQFLANMKKLANQHESVLFEIPGTSPQGTADWLKWRTYFITSSNVKFVVNQSHSENATKNFFLRNLWLQNKGFETIAMRYGKENETKARNQYAATFLQDNQRMIEVGLVVNKRTPHLATSLDGIVMEGADIHHIIEIKCPKVLEKCQELSAFDDVLSKSQLGNFFLVKKNGKIFIRDNHPYLYQIISSLFILEAETCHLVVWSPKSLLVVPVCKKNHLDIVEKIRTRSALFYHNIYVPEMFAMRTVRDLPPINLAQI